MKTGYEKVPTEKLRFALGVGKAGLTMWKGKQLAEVKRQCALMEEELKKRECSRCNTAIRPEGGHRCETCGRDI